MAVARSTITTPAVLYDSTPCTDDIYVHPTLCQSSDTLSAGFVFPEEFVLNAAAPAFVPSAQVASVPTVSLWSITAKFLNAMQFEPQSVPSSLNVFANVLDLPVKVLVTGTPNPEFTLHFPARDHSAKVTVMGLQAKVQDKSGLAVHRQSL